LVFLVGISWYFPGSLPTDTEGSLGWYILVSIIWREPPFPYEGGLWPPFCTLSPPFEEKGILVELFKKEFPQNLQKVFPPKLTVQKYQPEIPTDQCGWMVNTISVYLQIGVNTGSEVLNKTVKVIALPSQIWNCRAMSTNFTIP